MGSESMTYAEMKGLGYGTVKERLGKVTTWSLPLSLPGHLEFVQLFVEGSALEPPASFLEALYCSLSSDGSPELQDAVGNYSDCRLTLQPVVVRPRLQQAAQHDWRIMPA